MSTVNLFLLGGVGVAVILLVGWLVTQPDPSEPRRPRGYRPAHRSQPVPWKPDVEAPLPPAHALEEQLVSFPVGHPEQARAVITAEQIQRDYEVVKHPTSPWLDHLALKQERTEEMPVVETPVVHVEAGEEEPEVGAIGTVAPEVSPDMARVLTSQEQAIADVWDEAHLEHEVRTEVARVFAPIERALVRLGHAEQDTCEISFEHLRLAVEAERAGAL